MGCPCRAAGVGISGEPSCSSGTVPTSLGNGAACPAMVGLAAVAQVTRWCQVDLASALCSVSSASVFHVLRNYCLPGFYQDNMQCPYFTFEMFSSGIRLGRGNPNPQAEWTQSPQAEDMSRTRRHLPRAMAFVALLGPSPAQLQLLTSYL